jgi:hypothetical protein
MKRYRVQAAYLEGRATSSGGDNARAWSCDKGRCLAPPPLGTNVPISCVVTVEAGAGGVGCHAVVLQNEDCLHHLPFTSLVR